MQGNLCFTVHYFYPKLVTSRLFKGPLSLVLSITIVLDCFKLHAFYFEKFSTQI